MTLLNDLGLEFWAVVASHGVRGIALVRVSLYDLHSGHYRFDLTSLQYGVAGRLLRNSSTNGYLMAFSSVNASDSSGVSTFCCMAALF